MHEFVLINEPRAVYSRKLRYFSVHRRLWVIRLLKFSLLLYLIRTRESLKSKQQTLNKHIMYNVRTLVYAYAGVLFVRSRCHQPASFCNGYMLLHARARPMSLHDVDAARYLTSYCAVLPPTRCNSFLRAVGYFAIFANSVIANVIASDCKWVAFGCNFRTLCCYCSY